MFSGNQEYLNALRVSVPRGPNPYDCPDMGDYTQVKVQFTDAMAEAFYAPVIWTYVKAALVQGSQGYQTPQTYFGNMVTRNGTLWQGFDTAPLPLPVNDRLYSGPVAASVPAVGVSVASGSHVRAGLQGLGAYAAPTLVTIPGTSIQGYLTPQGYIIPGNTNGNPVDVFNWIWWAYVNRKATCSPAWGSSAGLKTWGAVFKPYSSVIDKIAPGLIETAVIVGTTYGLASGIASMGSAASAGTDAGTTGAVTGDAYTGETATQLSTTNLTDSLTTLDTVTAVGTGTGTLLTTVGSGASAIATGLNVAKTAVGVALATGLIKKPTSTTAAPKPTVTAAPAGSPASSSVFHYLAPIAMAVAGAFALLH